MEQVGPSLEWLEEAEAAAAAAVTQTGPAAVTHLTKLATEPVRPAQQESVETGAHTTLPPWFGPTGHKLNTAEWQRHGFDSAAIRNEADWLFQSVPEESRHLKNYPSIVPHRDAMGAYFDKLLMAGVTEAYNPVVHGSEADFAAVINLLHVVVKAGSSMRPVLDPTRSGVNAHMRQLPCSLPRLVTILRNLAENGFWTSTTWRLGFTM